MVLHIAPSGTSIDHRVQQGRLGRLDRMYDPSSAQKATASFEGINPEMAIFPSTKIAEPAKSKSVYRCSPVALGSNETTIRAPSKTRTTSLEFGSIGETVHSLGSLENLSHQQSAGLANHSVPWPICRT